MKVVYQAANAVEAHMILHLLEQQGLSGRVDGEYLQGGIGELPAAGLVRVMVAEKDHPAAQEIVDRWDAIQPTQAPAPAVPKPGGTAAALALGLVAGTLCTYAYFYVPVQTQAIDHDRDGRPDEAWTLAPDGSLVERTADRDFDGNTDRIIHYDRRGVIESVEADDDFDTVFESRTAYRLGMPSRTETDTDADGFRDRRINFDHGVPASVEYLLPATGLAEKIEYYRSGRLSHSERDGDMDGVMDKRTTYDRLGEPVGVENIR